MAGEIQVRFPSIDSTIIFLHFENNVSVSQKIPCLKYRLGGWRGHATQDYYLLP